MFLSPDFVSNLRTQLRVIQEQPYKAFLNSKNSWWQYVAKVMPTATEKQVVMWLLQTAQLKGTGLSTDVIARDLTILKQEFTPENVSAAMKMSLNKFKDTDANGMNILAGWVEQISAQAAYFPQKQIGAAIVNGTAAASANYTYDKQKAPQSLQDLVTEGYLREIPSDPMTNSNQGWRTVMEDAAQSVNQAEPGIFDVRSGSDKMGLDGTSYSEW